MYVGVSVWVQNTSNFVSRTPPTILLLLYWRFLDTLNWTEVMQEAVLNHLLPMVQRLSPLECSKFLLTRYHTILTFNDHEKESFWKHCGKRRKCWKPAFSPFPTMFSTLLNPFPNKPWFLHVCSTSLLKTLWEKQRLLITSNFSFGELSAIFIKFEIVICKLFRIGRV